MKPMGGQSHRTDERRTATCADPEISNGQRGVIPQQRHGPEAQGHERQAKHAQASRAQFGGDPRHDGDDRDVTEEIARAEQPLVVVTQPEVLGHARQNNTESKTREPHCPEHHQRGGTRNDPRVVAGHARSISWWGMPSSSYGSPTVTNPNSA